MGVWIETLGLIVIVDSIKVTPCVGVWIETDNAGKAAITKSHTLRGCVD